MDDRFLKKVAPPVLYVLSVLEKIESSQGASPPPAAIRPRIKQLVGPFNVRGPEEETHRLAKSALVYWIDEVLVTSRWKFSSDWQNHPLELELYGTRSRAWRFFENAADARSLESLDALEVFALCVANGFQGVYRSDVFRPDMVNAGGLPAEDLLAIGAQGAGGHGRSANGAAVAEPTSAKAVAGYDPIRESQLPATLDEWTSSVFQQLLEERMQPFQCSKPYDSVRSAKPLSGSKTIAMWLTVLALSVASTIGLIAVGGSPF